MKKNYIAYVNGKDVFIDNKLVEKVIARGISKGCCQVTLACGAVTAIGLLGCYLADKFVSFGKHSNCDTDGDETEAF